MKTPLVLFAASILALSGCVANTGTSSAKAKQIAADNHAVMHGMDGMDAAGSPAGGLKIEAKNCKQGGGNSVYPNQMGKIGPFDAADQRPEVGDPMIGAYFAPVTGPSSGIWHVAVHCDSYIFQGVTKKDFNMGWVAEMIKRPGFDTWGNPRIEYMVADLSFGDADIVKEYDDMSHGAMISLNQAALIEWLVPQKYLHVTMEDANHGQFEFTAEIHKDLGKKTDDSMRWWMLPRADGTMDMDDHGESSTRSEAPEKPLYRPIAIDVQDFATGSGVKLAGESVGTFLHVQDLTNPAENHEGNPLGHYQDGFDRTITLGPQPEGITFDTTWTH